jgi:hypothetical protein
MGLFIASMRIPMALALKERESLGQFQIEGDTYTQLLSEQNFEICLHSFFIQYKKSRPTNVYSYFEQYQLYVKPRERSSSFFN